MCVCIYVYIIYIYMCVYICVYIYILFTKRIETFWSRDILDYDVLEIVLNILRKNVSRIR